MLLRLRFEVAARGKQTARTSFFDARGEILAKPRTWTPRQTEELTRRIRMEARSQINRQGLRRPVIPHPQPVFLVSTYRLKRPLRGVYATVLYPTRKPDLSNMTKLVEDALTGELWTDDSQVVTNLERKVWAPDGCPSIELLVADLEGLEGLFPNLVGLAQHATGGRSLGGSASSPATSASTRTTLPPVALVAGIGLITSGLSFGSITTAAMQVC